MPIVTNQDTVITVPSGNTPPPRGVLQTDPTFGTEFMRVTDSTTSPNLGGPRYSYWSPFNSDNTYILNHKQGQVFPFNPSAWPSNPLGSPIDLTSAVGAGYTSSLFEDMQWSRTIPNVLYYRANSSINKVTINSDGTVTVGTHINLSSYKSANFSTALRPWQMHISEDDKRFSFSWVLNGGGYLGYTVWDTTTNSAIFTSTDGRIDEVQISKDGAYLLHKVQGADQGPGKVGNKVIRLSDGNVVNVIDDTEWALGHSDNGYNMAVGYANYQNYIVGRPFANPVAGKYIVLDLGQAQSDWIDIHVCFRRNVNDDWILISTNNVPVGWALRNELILLKTDGSQTIRRFLHHRNTGSSYNIDLAFANISKDGRWVAWGSTWNNPGTRSDMYLARLDDTTYGETVFGGGSTPSAPTAGIVDDVGNTFDWTNNPSFASLGDYEYTLNGGSTWATVTAKPISVGNVVKAAGQVGVRVKSLNGNPASATLSNSVAFTLAGSTPDTPTLAVVDDANNTFNWTNNPSFTSLSDYEYTLDGGNTWTTVANKPVVVGNVAKAIGQVGVRVKSLNGNPSSNILYNSSPYTVSGGGDPQDTNQDGVLTYIYKWNSDVVIK